MNVEFWQGLAVGINLGSIVTGLSIHFWLKRWFKIHKGEVIE